MSLFALAYKHCLMGHILNTPGGMELAACGTNTEVKMIHFPLETSAPNQGVLNGQDFGLTRLSRTVGGQGREAKKSSFPAPPNRGRQIQQLSVTHHVQRVRRTLCTQPAWKEQDGGRNNKNCHAMNYKTDSLNNTDHPTRPHVCLPEFYIS
jgi:hypothetical protein